MISRSHHAQTKGKLGFQRLGDQPKQSRHCFPQNTLTHNEPSVSPLPIAPITEPDYTPPATLSSFTQHPVPTLPKHQLPQNEGGGKGNFFHLQPPKNEGTNRSFRLPHRTKLTITFFFHLRKGFPKVDLFLYPSFILPFVTQNRKLLEQTNL